MAHIRHDPLRDSSGPGLDIIAGSDRGQLPHHTPQAQARLQIRAIVAARRIEDHRLDAEERRREFDDTLAALRSIEPVIARAAEVLDNYSSGIEELLALLLALLPDPPRELLTPLARQATETPARLPGILNQLANQLAAATEQLDDGGAP